MLLEAKTRGFFFSSWARQVGNVGVSGMDMCVHDDSLRSSSGRGELADTNKLHIASSGRFPSDISKCE
jgi:hypothetical protein